MSWFVQIMGETLGPFVDGELVQMAASGRIQQDTPISHGKAGPWSTAAHVRGLFEAAQHAGIPMPTVSLPKPALPTEAVAVVAARDPAVVTHVRQESDGPYKVITQRDRWFAGKFDPDRLEGAINAYAASGWKVCGLATTTFQCPTGKREEVVVLMERRSV